MALHVEIDDLFAYAMKGQWDEVVKIYKRSPVVRKAKITKSEDTTLHTAVSVGQTDTALELVEICEEDILELENAKGNTALHIAAALGNLRVCKSMISKNQNLIALRNLNGETPLFLAALHGKIEAFLYLHTLSNEDYLVRRNDGDTILHAAISGEYFRLAMSIMREHPNLADSINENGLSPLHILASMPNAFKSSSRFGLFDRIIYHSIVVDELKEETHDIDTYIKKGNRKEEEILTYPQNYKTCINFFGMLFSVFQVTFSKFGVKGKKKDGRTDEENPQRKSSPEHGTNQFEGQQSNDDRFFPPNYEAFILFFNVIMKVLLIILGIGIWRINKIERKKKLHMWAERVMDELVKHTTSYKFYDNTGWDPNQTRGGGPISPISEEFALPNDPASLSTTSSSFKNELKGKDHNETGKRHTPILMAAKMGVTEMVEKILKEFPVAIQDLDSENKNVVLLAVENRQPQVYNLLLHSEILKESIFRQLDKDGNSALHLAAQCKEQRPWLIPGVALQMQWEIKWYKFVKKSMPPQFFPRYNAKHETPKEIFIGTHKELTKEGGKWLVKTSESCSVVAALVATVAFATSATIPGGVNENTGKPLLLDKAVFGAFSISSLVALCFSVTALVFFLSILTSRCQEKDFAMDLPRKLLLGLTSLFASIPSIVVSFCDGHIFILSHKLKYAAYPLYAALCFPITYFLIAQLSLYFDLVWAIFKKIPQRSNQT
ncbi:Ankyrin repeat-containing protein [Morus notabilis]|uniref:Ankyrin repeat-containing protein n=1 Tax=Morus notabilis TaxID=981085 RepID=W9S8J0_9ROSA|nr:uncharacterized protein LOC21404462 [Morus notabilis]EXC16955.1 Ankyrin repeat-containing protein [Morus notabilis]